jgi:acyl-CoA reductase-like NAD-dependent aldehyde dehydrogenase
LGTAVPSARDEAGAAARRLAGSVVVDGKLGRALATETFIVENPADGQAIAQAPRCAAPDVERAVHAAHRSFAGWARMPARERGNAIARVAEQMEAERESLARLLALETGNAIATQARPEVNAAVDMLRLFAGLASELKGKTLPWEAGTLCYTTRDPVGVVAAIIPWNAPLLLTAAKLGPALVAGNTVVLKPAEQAPLAALHVVAMMQKHLPPGVANAVTGFGEEAGQPLASHPLVRKVTFTGSCQVGMSILRYCADRICPATLELGGKSPNIVLPDADLELAVPGILTGMRFTRQGQSCSAGTRIYIHEDVYDTVIARVLEHIARLKIGDPLDERTEVGAVISREQLERIEHYVDIARRTPGVRILCGGSRPQGPAFASGHFYTPTLIEGVPSDSPVCREEIFGPVALVSRWRDFDAVLAEANDSDFGLAAALWTRDLARALAFAERIQAGFVQVNQFITPRPGLAYGGLKSSGLGKEYSLESMLDHFTTSKTVIVNPGSPAPLAFRGTPQPDK